MWQLLPTSETTSKSDSSSQSLCWWFGISRMQSCKIISFWGSGLYRWRLWILPSWSFPKIQQDSCQKGSWWVGLASWSFRRWIYKDWRLVIKMVDRKLREWEFGEATQILNSRRVLTSFKSRISRPTPVQAASKNNWKSISTWFDYIHSCIILFLNRALPNFPILKFIRLLKPYKH